MTDLLSNEGEVQPHVPAVPTDKGQSGMDKGDQRGQLDGCPVVVRDALDGPRQWDTRSSGHVHFVSPQAGHSLFVTRESIFARTASTVGLSLTIVLPSCSDSPSTRSRLAT
jgi:hypothetical protein